MTDATQDLGGRLPLADPNTLNEQQRELFAELNTKWARWAGKAGVAAATEDGRPIGPFNSFLLRPRVGAKFLDFASTSATDTVLSARVREVVIIGVGAVWGADYELYAHTAMGRKAGLSDQAVTTLARGGIPDDLSEDEKIAARLVSELSTRRRVDDELYRKAEEAFGPDGLFDIAALMGQYQTVCTLLTLFEVPAPG
jgi:4-carboxymuconolactone decarboxylase